MFTTSIDVLFLEPSDRVDNNTTVYVHPNIRSFNKEYNDKIVIAGLVIFQDSSGDGTANVIKNIYGPLTLINKDIPIDQSGYHTTEIRKGVIGDFSKVEEEWQEVLDARKQDSKVMELVELSDMIGAIDLYLKNKFNMSVLDLTSFSEITQRAFKSGHRS